MRPYSETPARVFGLLNEMHDGIRMEVEYAADHVQPGLRLLVVGSYRGHFARYIAWCFEATELHMVDKATPPDAFEPFCPETFYQLDVMSDEFVQALAGKVDIIVSFMLTHELEQPEQGLTNILRLLPKQPKSFAWFLDLSAFRWRVLAEEFPDGVPDEYLDHVKADLENVRRHGLDDQERAYACYEVAVRATGHQNWSKAIINGGYAHVQDIYEVTVGDFR